MNRFEAKRILVGELKRIRDRSYADLCRLVGEPEAYEVRGSSGVQYQLEVSAFWDDEPDQDLRVIVSIDDGGLRAYCPMGTSFILAPDGSFVGE